MADPFTNGGAQPGPRPVRALLTADCRGEWVRPAPGRVLVVDDKPEMRELLMQLFQQWSYTVVTAASVAEARRAAVTQGPFTIVVCDFQLGDGDGLQFWSWLKLARGDGARFLLMSGSASFVRHHSDDFAFLPKPFRPEELRRRVLELTGTESR